MGKAGLLLTTLGFLAGAFLASLDPREINWVGFVPALLVGFHIAGATALFVAVIRLGLLRTEPETVADTSSTEAVLR